MHSIAIHLCVYSLYPYIAIHIPTQKSQITSCSLNAWHTKKGNRTDTTKNVLALHLQKKISRPAL